MGESQHLLTKYGILVSFDVVSITDLNTFMDLYNKVANTDDNISEMSVINKLLTNKVDDIPGLIPSETDAGTLEPVSKEIDHISTQIINYMKKKTKDPDAWREILEVVIERLEIDVDDE